VGTACYMPRVSRPACAAFLLVLLAGCNSSSSSPPASSPTDSGGGAGPDSGGPASFDFTAFDQELFGGNWVTDGALVMVNGQIAYERYANGYTASMRHITFSATKSIGSALIGIAVGKGLMATSDSVCKYVTPPPGADPTLCDTTIEHLLHMGSGLAWAEDYGADPSTSNVLQMLYGNQGDMGAYTASLARAAPAGSTFNYSSGDANLLALALKGALKGQDARAWANTVLFQPAGMASALFEEDRSGTLVFSSYCFLTLRDFATFGQMFLDDGLVNGIEVVPQSWIAYSVLPAPSVAQPTSRLQDAGPGPGGSYGAQWWLNSATPTASSDTFEYPHAPPDAYEAEGHWGQHLVIVPSLKMVIARMGNDRNGMEADAMIGDAVTAVGGGH
jgi:CubicO group peptidase (beta-lactamase class C family)